MQLMEKTLRYALGDQAVLTDLAAMVRQDPSPHDHPFMIHIGGPSAAGKSTLAANFSAELHDADVLSIDDYLAPGLWDQTREYVHDPIGPDEPPYISGISPEIWDLDKLENDIERLQKGLPINRPVFDETLKDRVGYEPFAARRYLLLEGGHSFDPRFIGFADMSVHTRATLHDRLMRKIVRSTKKYQLDEVDEVMSRYIERDEMSNRHYDPIFSEVATRIVETVATPRQDFAHLEEDSSVSGKRKELYPLPATGTLNKEEELELIIGPRQLHIAYSVCRRLLVCRKISPMTMRLLQQCYEVEE